MEKLYTIPEAAQELKCSVTTIRRRIKSGELKACRNGKLYLITQSQLDSFLQGDTDSTADQPVRNDVQPTEADKIIPLPESWK